MSPCRPLSHPVIGFIIQKSTIPRVFSSTIPSSSDFIRKDFRPISKSLMKMTEIGFQQYLVVSGYGVTLKLVQKGALKKRKKHEEKKEEEQVEEERRRRSTNMSKKRKRIKKGVKRAKS